MHPVSRAPSCGPHVRITAQDVSSLFAEFHLIEMITAYPFPNNITLPCDLDDRVIDEGFVADLRIRQVFMRKNQKTFLLISGILIVFLAIFASSIQSSQAQAPHSYWAMQNDLYIDGLDYYSGYGDLDAGDHIYGYIETASQYDAVDFFICNVENYNLWKDGYTASYKHQ